MDIQAFLTDMIRGATALRDFAIALAASAVGWYYMVSAGWRLARWNDPKRQYGAGSVVGRSVVGTMFINASSYLNMMAITFTGFGLPDANSMSVISGGGGGVPQMVVKTALIWLACLGVIAMLRGAQLIAKASDNGSGAPTEKDPMFTGLVFIVSGAIGVNLWRFASSFI